MRIKKVFGQDKKGTRPLTPRDKSGLLAMTWKIEQCKGERSCPLFSGNPPPHMSKKRERGRKNNRLTLAHEVAGLAR
ncbi:hypothetical protein OSB04_un000931 [Centaurea solstitialis]|uniref:Uncharacterized protein n=1 Tax=Centaurea solstitialis TaxID=347529 RepID=A0AA38SGS6_9ASTR|nr:hypothetical protein OSB04_un000931 [Centaurea solstitialis]